MFSKIEIKEILLKKIKTIKSETENTKSKIDLYECTWASMRGSLYDMIGSIRIFNNIISGIKKEDERLVGYPLDFETAKEVNNGWLEKLHKIANADIDPNLMEFPKEVDGAILTVCYDIIQYWNSVIPLIEKNLNDHFDAPLADIQNFISDYPQYLSGNWAIAVTHLSAMDIAINKKRLELGLIKSAQSDVNTQFQKRYSELRDNLKANKIVMEGDVEGKAHVLWNIRTQILHYGMNPDKLSLDLISSWSRNVIDNLEKVEKD